MTIHPHANNMAQTQGFDLVVLAGGAATRLGEIAQKTPKSLLPIQGCPCILWQIESIVTALPALKTIHMVIRAIDEVQFKAIIPHAPRPVNLIIEHTPLGTGGAIYNALTMPNLSSLFLVMNGDVLFTPTPYELIENAAKRGASMQCIEVPDTTALGHLTVFGDRITKMQRGTGGQGAINAGLYAFNTSYLRSLSLFGAPPIQPLSFEDDIVPILINAGKLGSVKTIGTFIDIGTPSAYVAAQSVARKTLASQSR